MSRRSHRAFSALIVILTLILSILPGVGVQAQTDDTITITGRVVNGTPGGQMPVGAPVELRVFDDTAVTGVYTDTVASEGTFRFDVISTRSEDEFIVSTIYQGVRYASTPTPLSQEGSSDVRVKIYEITRDDAHIYVEQAHLFILPRAERVQIAEVYSVSNTGDRTYVGKQTALADGTTLRFTLPAEARNLNVSGSDLGGRYVGDESTLADTQPVRPGTATVEISFSYERPYSDGMRVIRTLELPIQSALVLLQSGNLAAEGVELSFNGVMETQMGNAASYLAGPLAADEALDFTIRSQRGSDEPGEMPAGSDETNVTLGQSWKILIGAGALAVAGLATFALWAPTTIPEIPASARPVLFAILQLDRDHAEGEVDEAEYRAKRKALKEKLRSDLDRRGTL